MGREYLCGELEIHLATLSGLCGSRKYLPTSAVPTFSFLVHISLFGTFQRVVADQGSGGRSLLYKYV